jgi:hypothetical protein
MLNSVFQSMEHHYAQVRFIGLRVKQANDMRTRLNAGGATVEELVAEFLPAQVESRSGMLWCMGQV